MKRIDSDALGVVTRALGITGKGSPQTDFADGILDQALTVNDLVRRGRTQLSTTGIYTPAMQNIHPGADSILNTVNPYTNIVGIVPPWPSTGIGPEFDIWLLGCAVSQVGGTTWDGAVFINPPGGQQGWGVTDAGVAVVSVLPQAVARFDSTAAATFTMGLTAGQELPWMPVRLRIPRGATILWATDSAAAVTLTLQLWLGLFPIALGQDGLV